MTQHALYVQLEAKPGMEQEVASFLSSARSMVDDEPETTAWFAIRMGNSTFGIFDAWLIAVLCGWDAQPVGFVVWRIGESRSSGRCETLIFSKRR